jgi:hypothetical protein
VQTWQVENRPPRAETAAVQEVAGGAIPIPVDAVASPSPRLLHQAAAGIRRAVGRELLLQQQQLLVPVVIMRIIEMVVKARTATRATIAITIINININTTAIMLILIVIITTPTTIMAPMLTITTPIDITGRSPPLP